MAITRLNKHDTHPTSIHLCQQPSKHYAALRCVTCDKHIQWLSRKDADLLLYIDLDIWYTMSEELLDDKINFTIRDTEINEQAIELKFATEQDLVWFQLKYGEYLE